MERMLFAVAPTVAVVVERTEHELKNVTYKYKVIIANALFFFFFYLRHQQKVYYIAKGTDQQQKKLSAVTFSDLRWEDVGQRGHDAFKSNELERDRGQKSSLQELQEKIRKL